MPDNYNPAWMQGYATALADMHRLYRNTSQVEQTMASGGITIAHLTRAKVNSYDVNELRKCVDARKGGGK
jgi:hypothetical protein